MVTTKIEWQPTGNPRRSRHQGRSFPRARCSRGGGDFSAVNDTTQPSLGVAAASPVITLNPITITSFYNMLWPRDQYIKRAGYNLAKMLKRAAARPRRLLNVSAVPPPWVGPPCAQRAAQQRGGCLFTSGPGQQHPRHSQCPTENIQGPAEVTGWGPAQNTACPSCFPRPGDSGSREAGCWGPGSQHPPQGKAPHSARPSPQEPPVAGASHRGPPQARVLESLGAQSLARSQTEATETALLWLKTLRGDTFLPLELPGPVSGQRYWDTGPLSYKTPPPLTARSSTTRLGDSPKKVKTRPQRPALRCLEQL